MIGTDGLAMVMQPDAPEPMQTVTSRSGYGKSFWMSGFMAALIAKPEPGDGGREIDRPPHCTPEQLAN